MNFNFIKEIFSDVDKQGSQKRLITFGIFLLIAYIVISVTSFKATFVPDIWRDLIFALLVSLGFVASEKFTKRGVSNDSKPDDTKQ